jgi:hypothetical protein
MWRVNFPTSSVVRTACTALADARQPASADVMMNSGTSCTLIPISAEPQHPAVVAAAPFKQAHCPHRDGFAMSSAMNNAGLRVGASSDGTDPECRDHDRRRRADARIRKAQFGLGSRGVKSRTAPAVWIAVLAA